MREKIFLEETPSTEYGRVVDALWAQETQRGRKEFHIWAVYTVSSAARKEVVQDFSPICQMQLGLDPRMAHQLNALAVMVRKSVRCLA